MSKPKSKEELNTWMAGNQGAEFLFTRTSLIRELDGSHKFEVEDRKKKRKVNSVQSNGVYFHGEDIKNQAWFGIEQIPEESFLFRDDYFAAVLINVIPYDNNGNRAQIITMKYEYIESLASRPNVRWVLGTSVGDIDYYKGSLTTEELIYCLKNEKRKTGIRKLISEAKKRPAYWNNKELSNICIEKSEELK